MSFSVCHASETIDGNLLPQFEQKLPLAFLPQCSQRPSTSPSRWAYPNNLVDISFSTAEDSARICLYDLHCQTTRYPSISLKRAETKINSQRRWGSSRLFMTAEMGRYSIASPSNSTVVFSVQNEYICHYFNEQKKKIQQIQKV